MTKSEWEGCVWKAWDLGLVDDGERDELLEETFAFCWTQQSGLDPVAADAEVLRVFARSLDSPSGG